jgi:hypothetical protein
MLRNSLCSFRQPRVTYALSAPNIRLSSRLSSSINSYCSFIVKFQTHTKQQTELQFSGDDDEQQEVLGSIDGLLSFRYIVSMGHAVA